MKFKATEMQIAQLILNAINNSTAVGMGFLQYKKKKYLIEDIVNMHKFKKIGEAIVWGIPYPSEIDIDYFEGRMVKLLITAIDKKENMWEVRSQKEPDIQYQSWASVYPTWESLLASADIKEIQKEG